MDTNSVAPFNMYANEFIVWLEKRKKEITTKKSVFLTILYFSLYSIVGIAIFYAIAFLYDLIIVGIIIFLLFFVIPLIFSIFFTRSMFAGQFIYYVTNFRLIELKEVKKSENNIVKYGYLSELKDITITTSSNGEVSLEFDWNIQEPNSWLCYGFQNIDNADEIYKIIIEQKSMIMELTNVADNILQ